MGFTGKSAWTAGFILLSASAMAFVADAGLPVDYAPGIEFCPPGLEALPQGNAVDLAEAALACHEHGLIDDAVVFHIAATARAQVDRSLDVSVDLFKETLAFQNLTLRLFDRLEDHYQEIDPVIAAAAIDAYPRVFQWELQVDGYDPGFAIQKPPVAEDYRRAFRMAVAAEYAMTVQGLHSASDPEYIELYNDLHQADQAYPIQMTRPLAESQALAARLVVRQKEIADTFIADFVPSLIETHVLRYGVYETVGDVEHFPAEETADGTRIVAESVHLDTSLVVPAEVGLSFGFEYELAGFIPGTNEHLKMRAIHPPMRNPRGEWQTVSTTAFDAFGWNGRVDDSLLYRFSEPHQVLPGEWTLQIIYFGEVLISKIFQVVESGTCE